MHHTAINWMPHKRESNQMILVFGNPHAFGFSQILGLVAYSTKDVLFKLHMFQLPEFRKHYDYQHATSKIVSIMY